MKKVVVDSGSENTAQEAVQEVVESDGGTLQFPEESREPLRGLLFLGELRDTFEYSGHSFTVRTLKEGELIQASRLISEHEGTLAYELAYHGIIAAACLVEVDGRPLYEPLGANDDVIAKKFDLIKDWYPVVIDKVYEAYISLEEVVLTVAKSLGEA